MIGRSGCGIPSKIQRQVAGKYFEGDVLRGHPVLQLFILLSVPTSTRRWLVARHILAKRMEDDRVKT
jgi:hypothetical protein